MKFQLKFRRIGFLRGIASLVVPHQRNNFHPHILRPLGVGMVIAGALVLYAAGNQAENGQVKGASVVGFSQETLLAATNNARAQNHAPPLQSSLKLAEAAHLKANDMMQKQYWAHTAPDGTTPWHWMDVVGYSYGYAGENLAKGFTNPNGVIVAWMNSPEHRQNLISHRYHDVGFGIVHGTLEGNDTTLIVALYGTNNSTATSPSVLAVNQGDSSLATKIGTNIQTMNPAALSAILLLLFIVFVALATYTVRNRLPKDVRKTWQRHHALYTAVLVCCLIFGLVALYGNGQIL